MPRDIDTVIEKVRALHPEATIRQHQVAHVGVDDDGLWFFSIPKEKKEIMVESGSGEAPFLIEHSDMLTTADTIWDASVDRAISEVSAYLDTLKNRANQSPEGTPVKSPPSNPGQVSGVPHL